MYEIRLHGRGGQGVVTAAELLSVAAFRQGRYAQAFPSFGSERTGAPVMAFCRIDTRPIRLREPVLAPHALIVQDTTLLHQIDVFGGLRPAGLVLLNAPPDAELPRPPGHADVVVVAVPASRLAREHVGRPVPNAALLGGLAAASGQVDLDSVVAAIRARFPGDLADGNAAAATRAYELVREHLKEPFHA
jgi:pyruvate ferredoxin oxidoreductase gamma subunit